MTALAMPWEPGARPLAARPLALGRAWRLGDLIAGLADAGAAGNRLVSGLALESADVLPGCLFFADPGSFGDGLLRAEEAASRGASAILADPCEGWPIGALAALEARTGAPVICVPDLGRRAGLFAARFFDDPSARLDVVGVVGGGSCAALCHLLAQALGGAGSLGRGTCGLVGWQGDAPPEELTSVAAVAFDAVTLQAVLAGFASRGASAAVVQIALEGADRNLPGTRLDYAVFAHRDGPVDLGEVRKLLDAPGLRWLVADTAYPALEITLAGLDPSVQVAAYALDSGAGRPDRCNLWVAARTTERGPGGLALTVETDRGAGRLEISLVGSDNAGGLLAALAVLLTRDLPLGHALRDLARVRSLPGHMESFGGDGAPLVVVDAAHTPDALEKALTDLRCHTRRRLIAVLGCGGERDRGNRPLMGAIAERLADALILTDANPRREDGDSIVADILGGMLHPARVRVERQRGLAIRRAITLAGADDGVLVAGRGVETIQDLGGLTVHFSDRAQVVEALREWREGHH